MKIATKVTYSPWLWFYQCRKCDAAGEDVPGLPHGLCPKCGSVNIDLRPGRWKMEAPVAKWWQDWFLILPRETFTVEFKETLQGKQQNDTTSEASK